MVSLLSTAGGIAARMSTTWSYASSASEKATRQDASASANGSAARLRSTMALSVAACNGFRSFAAACRSPPLRSSPSSPAERSRSCWSWCTAAVICRPMPT
ncbi:hypothetical protein ONO86_03256 [Micromonospora noduli]|nr:hypothetical protein ONO86_03256 [Micromonospora noduli]